MGAEDPTQDQATATPGSGPGTGGSPSEAELLEALGSKATATPTADDLAERLKSFDPATLPENHPLRVKLEAAERSRQADYTRKTQALAERERLILDSLLQKVAAQGVTPTPDQRAQLLERVKQGDFEVLGDLMDAQKQATLATIQPTLNSILQRNAFEDAASRHPYVRERFQDVAAAINGDPIASEMTKDIRFLPHVLTAAASILEAADLRKSNAELKAKVEQLEKTAQEREAARAGRLPTSSSRAGTGPAGAPSSQEKGFDSALARAAAELGLGT